MTRASVYSPFSLTLNAKWPCASVTVFAESLPASLIVMVTPLTPLPFSSLRVPATQPRSGSTVQVGTAVMRALCTTVSLGEGVGEGDEAAEAGPPTTSTAPAVRAAMPRSRVMVRLAREGERMEVLRFVGTWPGPGRRCCRAPVTWWISP
ncbi:hypothetical protein [Amnibacterium kyonggiense]